MAQPISGSFTMVVDQVQALRKGNKYLAEKHGWALDRAGVEYDVEQQNVARCLAGGWTDFIQFDEAPAPPPVSNYEDSKKNRSGAVAGIKRISAGIGVLLEWLGSGAKPVENRLAEARAAICATCPKNDGGDWKAYFTGPIADKIRTQLEIKNDLQLKTSMDDKLTVCSGCDCPLPLKVHTPLNHVLAHTNDDVKKRLDPRCWVLHEKL